MQPTPMRAPEFCGVILAAGRSSRMGFNKLTALLANHSMVTYPYIHLRGAGLQRIVAVVGHDAASVKSELAGCDDFVHQAEQHGTADAARQALSAAGDYENVVILFGDCPFITDDIIASAMNDFLESRSPGLIATADLRDPLAMGPVVRNASGGVSEVRAPEHTGESIAFTQRRPGYTEVFAGLSIWRHDFLAGALESLEPKRRGDRIEYDLPDVIQFATQRGHEVLSVKIGAEDALAPNFPEEFERAGLYMRSKMKSRLLAKGVRIYDPDKVRVDYEVEVGRGTTIRANTSLLGNTVIGDNCDIGPDVTLQDCVVGGNSQIAHGSWGGAGVPRRKQTFWDKADAPSILPRFTLGAS